ncbi:MAG: hypothetical protein ACOXZV_14080 [Bacteroidales bacterium]|jgi:hypothetical protein
MKHPLDITKDDLKEIENVPIRIGIGPSMSHDTNEIMEGTIVECSLAANPPHLPAVAKFMSTNGVLRDLTFFEIKWIEKL